jgi:hypothetical protein
MLEVLLMLCTRVALRCSCDAVADVKDVVVVEEKRKFAGTTVS